MVVLESVLPAFIFLGVVADRTHGWEQLQRRMDARRRPVTASRLTARTRRVPQWCPIRPPAAHADGQRRSRSPERFISNDRARWAGRAGCGQELRMGRSSSRGG